MKELEFLEQELNLLKDNIKRIREYKKATEKANWKPNNSNVIGELKHRAVALKQRLTIVSKMTTTDLFN